MTTEPNWRTSTYTKSDSCVEVADNDPTVVRVRDTKHREYGRMDLRPASWACFVAFTRQLPL
ncbi:DUF397 domain-containing protein [Streptomyces cyaneochromogenes]|uniref:DUF397 domain-containing protein n=1 Tax=Streptomyces cyaneochromogenes TaxID=2496836 RepID=A0A3S9MIT1_9ACTN|nr:DUF397 domain-containing protein [Streptomyces cyaneochromogenes]AZQ39083.1 DUF397 domain-containing protein [Streptomyces cyaneochromogenes]